MTGKTHQAVGVATSLAILHGTGTKEMVVGSLVALMASTIPDIDLIDNQKGKGIEMVFEVIKQSLIPLGFAVYCESDLYMIGLWIALMILFVVQPHRGLTHSVWAMIAMCGLFAVMTNERYIPWFLASYMSHLVIDLLNTKKVSIFYPFGFCLKICKADGFVNDLSGMAAGIVLICIAVCKMQGIDIVERGLMLIAGV